MKSIKNVLIILLILVIGFFVFSDPKYIGTGTSTTIVTKIDTFYKVNNITKYKKGDSIPFVLLAIDTTTIHDTIQVLNDYASIKVYTDTFHIDTANYVSIQDTISKNTILGRNYNSHFTTKTIVVTNDIYHKPKNELFVGLIGDLRRFDNNLGVGVGLNYKKQNESYTINFTTNQISLGLYKKLF
jgi:riboflavin transporter FmnP